jgi:4-amino-4-deoxy-L-arabinose transferase-like glycosyltransferase
MTHIEPTPELHISRRAPVTVGEIFFWAIAFFTMFWALGVRELWTAENRWAEITRNMMLSRDFFHPSINGQPYFDKPLLGYWTIALASLFGGKVDEWAVRLPSALAGLVTLWSTIFLGRRLWSAEIGRVAGWLLLSCYGFIFWARTGQADAENMAFIMLAIAWYWSRRNRPVFVTYAVFYLICFVGAQMKGLGALAVPCLAVLPDLLRDRRWRHLLTLSHVAALLLCSTIYFAPFIFGTATQGNYGESGLALVFRENVQRYVDPFDHNEPFYIYFYDLPILFLPWVPLLVVALIAAFSRGQALLKTDYPTRWAMEASLLVFLFFTASGSRRNYYILPLVPFCALLCARFLLAANFEKLRRGVINLQAGMMLTLALGGLLVCAAWLIFPRRAPIAAPPGFLLCLSLFSVLAIVPFALRRWNPNFLEQLVGTCAERAVPLLTTAILMCGYFCFQFVQVDALRTPRAFSRSVPVAAADKNGLAFYNVAPTAVATAVFYLDDKDPHRVLQNPGEVVQFLSDRPGLNSLMITRQSLDALKAELPANFTVDEIAAEPQTPIEGHAEKLKKWVIVQTRSNH